jgi:hypothetical protein
LLWGFFYQPAWTFSILLLPWLWFDRKLRGLTLAALFVLLGVSMYPFFFPHYLGPICAVILIGMVQALRRIRLWQWRGYPAGALFAMGTLVITVGGVMTPAGYFLMYSKANSTHRQIEDALAERGGNHLVLVRYTPQHVFHYTDIYNAADIDKSSLVWARDMGSEKNREILQYYKGKRQVWLFQPDLHPPRLEPYETKSPTLTNTSLQR